MKTFIPRIATHWTAEQAQITYHLLIEQANNATEEEVDNRVKSLMDAANASYSRVKCWSMPELIDRINKETGDTYSEMAAILCMVK